MKKILLTLLAGALLLSAGVLPVAAADTKPVAVVSLASYDELLSDVSFVGKLADRPELGRMLEGLVAMVTQGKGLAGIDKSRPLGLIVQSDGSQVFFYWFVPITDLKAVGELLELYATVEETDKGIYKVSPKNGKKPEYVRSDGRWAFVAKKPEWLAHVVADPTAVLAGLEKQYLVAGRLFAANVPSNLREMVLGQLQNKARADLEQQKPGESDQAYGVRKKVGQQVLGLLTGLLNDLDQVTLGWSMDRKAEKTALDLSVTARPGTPSAAQLALIEKTSSNFAGFRSPGATLVANMAGKIPAAKIEILTTLIDAVHTQALQDAQKKTPADRLDLAKTFIDDVAETLKKSVNSGRCDGAVAVTLDPKAATVVAGTHVADGALLDKALHSLAALAEKENPAVAGLVKFDAERAKDIRFHTVTIPIPSEAENREKVVQLIGEKLEVVIGIGPQSIYLAAGRDAMATLRRAIEASVAEAAHTVPPVEITLALEPLARFVATVGKDKDRPGAELIQAELKKTPGVDHIRLVAQPIPQGISYRLEVEQGIVRLVGRLAAMGGKHKP